MNEVAELRHIQRLEIRHIRYALEILVKGGVRQAAECLHTSAPNLSSQVKEFGELFNIRLFEKSPNNHMLATETGEALRQMGPDVLEALEDLITALIAIENREIRTLRLGSGIFVDRELFHRACEIHKLFVRTCKIQPTFADTTQLMNQVVSGDIHAALVTLPTDNPELLVEEIRRDRLVACLRADHPLAAKAALKPSDLQDHLRVFYCNQMHPIDHVKQMDLLREVGVFIDDFASASHPSEIQQLVKEGYGLTLIHEGTRLDGELTTRPILGVDWTVETAFVYHKMRHPETIPVLVRYLKKHFSAPRRKPELSVIPSKSRKRIGGQKRPPRAEDKDPEQMLLLG